MRQRLAALGLSATLAFAGGGAVACGNDADEEAERIQDEADEIIEEGGQKLEDLQESIEDNN